MKNKWSFILLFLFVIMGFRLAQDYVWISPAHFPDTLYDLTTNPLDSKKVAIGRMLFYDPLLSADGTISCASCHSPFNAFAHSDHKLSHGIHDSIGTRNAPALFNLAWQSHFMWDGAITHLDMQALAPISHPGEMGENIGSVCNKLQHSPLYPAHFQNAFGDSTITGEMVLKCLSQFQLTLISAGSKYDNVILLQDTFTDQEESGYLLFKEQCNQCHQEPLFSTYEFANNGLPMDDNLRDIGKGSVSGLSSDSLLFKIPSLRNLSYSYPYMHDGRFKKMGEVISHYSDNVKPDFRLSKPLMGPMNLTSMEKTDLIAFLLTLNDADFVFNKNHQFPRNLLLPSEGKGQ